MRRLSSLLAVLLAAAWTFVTAGPASASCHFAGFSASNYPVNENAGSVTITVTRVNSGCTPLQTGTVKYSTSDGPAPAAKAGSDYEAKTNETLTFAPGDSEKKFTVKIIDDSAFEGNETFTVTLSNPTSPITQVGPPATVTIQDNDPSPPPPAQSPKPTPATSPTQQTTSPSPTASPTPESPSPEASPTESPSPLAKTKDDDGGAPVALIVAIIAFVLGGGAGLGLWLLRKTPA